MDTDRLRLGAGIGLILVSAAVLFASVTVATSLSNPGLIAVIAGMVLGVFLVAWSRRGRAV